MPKIYDTQGNAKGNAKLPKIFSTKYKPSVIAKAFLAFMSAKRQPYGADLLAGKRSSAHYHGSRHYRYTMMNREMARIARIHGRVGYLAYRARVVPQAVKGRKAHPPKAEKVWAKKINKKELSFAIRSAIAATAINKLVKERGHKVDKLKELPIIFDGSLENVKKTKDVKAVLEKIIPEELKRCGKKKIKAGRAKMRGRKYKVKKGPLIIVSKACSLEKSARNIPGIDISRIEKLDIELLAPGAQAGRLAIITKPALEKLDKFGE